MSTITTRPHPGRVLPQLSGPTFVTDAGLETWLIFQAGFDLPHFAAFPMLDDDAGRAALDRYFADHFEIAERHGTGIVVDTATWRANPDWAHKLGYDWKATTDVNTRAVEYARATASAYPHVESVINGAIGPRGDGYVVGSAMTATEAASYHRLQVRAFAAAGVDLITAVTMTYVEEAIGIARAATEEGVPVAIGFTVETDGRLPSGTALGDAIAAVDGATDGTVAYFMINCAHPTHFRDALTEGAPWLSRVKAVRANASRMSHAELDEAEELDRGDPGELSEEYAELHRLLDLRVVGGCCGTDAEHVAAIARAIVG